MDIHVGPFVYRLILHHGLINFRGRSALGLCDSRRSIITISDIAPPQKRLSIFWHELAHAWAAEILQAPDALMSEEAMARMVAVAAAGMDAREMARIQIYLTQGIDAQDIMFLPGVICPIPVLHFSSPEAFPLPPEAFAAEVLSADHQAP